MKPEKKAPSGALERALIPLGQLVPNPRNAQAHDQPQIEKIAASLRKFSQTKPILVRKANRMIVAGHGVWEAAKLVRLEELDVILWDVDQPTADAFMLADNKLASLSTPDRDRMAALLSEIAKDDYAAVGFDDAEVAGILAELSEAELDVVEIETSRVTDRFWISVRGPLTAQADALQRLKAAMADLPDVQVELGTISE